ncbi:MAG: hypothetical protein WDZ59_12615 [Pirellulales bacterium]
MRAAKLAGLVLVVAVVALAFAAIQAPAQQQAAAQNRQQQAADIPSMAEAAKLTYQSARAAYEVGTEEVETVYRWSKRWMQAEDPPAVQAHLDRMETLQQRVAQLYLAGAEGGAATELYGTKFYVAEARAMLAEANDMPEEE